MLTFVFSAFTMSAVQTAAQSIVVEVRRQFREIAGIMEYKADPDYASCVGLCTKGALHEMVVPALLAIIVPIVTGLILGPDRRGRSAGRRVRHRLCHGRVHVQRRRRLGQRQEVHRELATTAARAPTATRPLSSATPWAIPSRIPPVPL